MQNKQKYDIVFVQNAQEDRKNEERRRRTTAGAYTNANTLCLCLCPHDAVCGAPAVRRTRRTRRTTLAAGRPRGCFFTPGGCPSVSKIPNSVKGQAVVFL